jgi:hypothetical protein
LKTESSSRNRRAAAFILTGMAAILATHVLRSHSKHFSDTVKWILGVMPNFAAAFSLPFFSVLPKVFWPESRINRMNPTLLFAFAAAGTFLLLLLWEAVQLWIWNIPFDPHDILAGGAGVLLSSLAYLTIM